MKKTALLLALLFSLISNASQEAVKPNGDGTSENPYQIVQIENLVWMNENMAKCCSSDFVMENDINAEETRNWIVPECNYYAGNKGFTSIGSGFVSGDGTNRYFSGSFDGKGHKIFNLYSESVQCSLFIGLKDAKVTNLRLENALQRRIYHRAKSLCGFLAQTIGNSVVSNCHVTGVSERLSQAGLSFIAEKSTILNCSFGGRIWSDSFYAAGLISEVVDCDISYCRAYGVFKHDCVNKTGCFGAGGLFGSIGGKTFVKFCYAKATLSSAGYVGGIAAEDLIEDYYEWDRIHGVYQCYSACTAELFEESVAGGIFGLTMDKSVCEKCYYDAESLKGGSRGTGVKKNDLMNKSTFKDWNFSNVWQIEDGKTTPTFRFLGKECYGLALGQSLHGKIYAIPEKFCYSYGEEVEICAEPFETCGFKAFKFCTDSSQSHFTAKVGSDNYYEAEFVKFISSPEEFMNLGSSSFYPSSGHYEQTCDLDMTGLILKQPLFSFNFYFKGNNNSQLQCLYFGGVYDGGNHKISNLTVKPDLKPYDLAIFGSAENAEIKNLHFENLSVESRAGHYGTLVKELENSKIENCLVSGDFKLYDNGNAPGGICFHSVGSTLANVGFVGTVSPCDMVLNLFAGMVGKAENSKIEESFVLIEGNAGFCDGIAYEMFGNKVCNCYVKGDLSRCELGSAGLCTFDNNNFFSNCYFNIKASTILPPSSRSVFVNCHYNSDLLSEKSNLSGSCNSLEMVSKSTYAGWDFESIWKIEEGISTPELISGFEVLPEPSSVALVSLILFGLATRIKSRC